MVAAHDITTIKALSKQLYDDDDDDDDDDDGDGDDADADSDAETRGIFLRISKWIPKETLGILRAP